MFCINYTEADSMCRRIIPITPLFSSLFCKKKPGRCPLVAVPDENILVQKTKSFLNIWRRS